MKALVLEEKGRLSLREIILSEDLSPTDVKIKIHTVGICGSDIHYYTHGAIGSFIVKEPMVLGHEAAGTVIEVGSEVEKLKVGDRVCMEPGVPNFESSETLTGIYNLDPDLKFWATPPYHGILRPTVIHPAALTFKLPDNVSYAEGAMIEPVSVGMHSVVKARPVIGDIAVVIGAGTIGMVTALCAIAGGCSKVIILDVVDQKLRLAESLGQITGVNPKNSDPVKKVKELTSGLGANIVFECSGNVEAASNAIDLLAAGGTLVHIGIPLSPISYDVSKAISKEIRVENVFRYRNVYPRAINLIASGKLNLMPLITDNFTFDKSIEAFDFAVNMPATSVKVQIQFPE
jgi:D-xylulose reductase